MVEKKIVVLLQHGLQARSGAEFVGKASAFNSDINIMKNGRSVVGKSIMGVMALAVRQGEEIKLTVDGDDEHRAIDTLEKFLLNKK
ncbi:HPr family phosphocarrier protein (plasmid) [Priestia aryabhattai]|uniref:HPr family phosphocarrier protein n=1 Tax=Priestia TaxID=2800373 RepID=UPI001A945632|nr:MULTISPECIES: HPr family phosphocarrier protein [Priestia]MDH3135402.1 HPr family phosphocarrier protein [Priestia aryabhattai]QSX23354.1 HPr family phosphocarrier protein [Priestia megaterium]